MKFRNFNVWLLKFQSLTPQYNIISPTFKVRQATPSQWCFEENQKVHFWRYSDNCLLRPGLLELQIKINGYISKQAKQRQIDWKACLFCMACLVSIACLACMAGLLVRFFLVWFVWLVWLVWLNWLVGVVSLVLFSG